MRLEIPSSGRVGTLITESVKESFQHFSSQINNSENVLIITRLSPRRLIRHITIENVDFRWLTMQESEHSINPSLEHVNHLIISTIEEGNGLIWVDGLEYLADRQGFDAVHSFIRNIVDSIGDTTWSVIISIEKGTFEETQLVQITREAREISIIQTPSEDSETDLTTYDDENHLEEEKSEKKEKLRVTGLKLLTKITREGFTQKTLRKRIMQWRGMNLDISILEPALNYQNPEDAYELYLLVENLVRTAVEIDARLDILKEQGETAKAYAYRYRIRQLTGLDEISRIVDTLLVQ
jgi:hypothetical protein